MPTEKEKKKIWKKKLRNKYNLIIRNDETFEEKISIRLTKLNVFIIVSSLIIILVVLVIYLVAFTSLREYIPGYTDVSLRKKLYELQSRADSLEADFKRKDLFIHNIKKIIEGEEIVDELPKGNESNVDYDTIKLYKSTEDSILRAEFENRDVYNLRFDDNGELYRNASSIRGFNFFAPIKGIITNKFNLAEKHYGIDIVAKKNEAIKATLDGTVIFSDWTPETGYVIGIQHKRNIISVYKHNSALLKEEGSFVKAGETVAIIGESGELTTGPHLHFELWYNGTPVNPEDYISF
ncbi:MAG: M23 family metallopeptidase [Bacteroidales bacterium]|nr:M23 family metallopeptidase [Bacteroidales bacterium]